EEVRDAEKRADEAERLRLYYVAMTRAIDRLIVSGAFDAERTRDRGTPIGWVLDRLRLAEEGRAGELAPGTARLVVSLRRPAHEEPPAPETVLENGQLALFEELPSAPAPRGYRLPELRPLPVPPLHRVRRLSYSALALYERCSYRYYAERVAGLREQRPEGTV